MAYVDPGIQGWKSIAELQWMFETAKSMDTIAEIGCWKGKGTHALCSGCKGNVVAIDPFSPALYGRPERKLSEGVDIMREFQRNTIGFQDLVHWRMRSADAPADAQFDMVFLDGQKSYSEYLRDIRRWLPRTKKLIAGYDYRDEEPVGVKRAVDAMFGEVSIVEKIWFKRL